MEACFQVTQLIDYLDSEGYPLQLVECDKKLKVEEREYRPVFMALVRKDAKVKEFVVSELDSAWKMHCYDETGKDLLDEPCVILDGRAFFKDDFLGELMGIKENLRYSTSMYALTNGESIDFVNFPEDFEVDVATILTI